MNKLRIKKINNVQSSQGTCIIYIMSRDQRVYDNYAFSYALEHAQMLNVPLLVVFNLYPKVNGRLYQQYEFMIEGLKEVQLELNKLNISFLVTVGSAVTNYNKIENSLNPLAVYFDFSPLRGPKKVKDLFAKNSKAPCFVVDAHNIVPVWEVSDKEEFAAYTIRPKIYKKIWQYLNEDTFKIQTQKDYEINTELLKDIGFLNPDLSDWQIITSKIKSEKKNNYNVTFLPGYKAALATLQDFIEHKLEFYGEKRNDPTKDYQSNLSPYLHFGHLSSSTVVKEVINYVELKTGLKIILDHKRNNAGHASSEKTGLYKGALAFIEEIVVRKELCENFCYYNEFYDIFDGIKPWARVSLIKHKNDRREHLFTLERLEKGETYDPAWNAAQRQMIKTGKIHGYMRMYWAKKILEWTENPKTAIEYAVYLNDKYHLDGYDPNGYAGILWSIGGLHDRPWFERSIFGQIRYMSYTGLKSKFQIKDYEDMFIELNH